MTRCISVHSPLDRAAVRRLADGEAVELTAGLLAAVQAAVPPGP